MAQEEKRIQRAILRAIGAMPDVLVFENPTGVGYNGSLGPRLCFECKPIARQHRISYGLCVGSSDLVGCVGGKALWMEVKTAVGKQREEQERFEAAVRARGSEYFLVRSVDDAVEAVRLLREAANGT